MNSLDKLEWTALEYKEKERSKDWFWALGITMAASAATALIYGNYFFAILILLSGALLWFLALKNPDLIHYEINDKGVKIESRIYPYENIRSFWIEASGNPTLFIKTERIFMPVISIPLENISGRISLEDIHNIFLVKEIPEEEMREHPALHIMEFFGF